MLAPDLPALAEAMPGFDVSIWYGVVAPAGTAPQIVDRLWGNISRILERPSTGQRLAELGLTVAPMPPEQIASFIATEIERWSTALHEAGVVPQ